MVNEPIHNNSINDLNALREAVGIAQHHDAITGTYMQYVSKYHIDKLKKEINNVENIFTNYLEDKYKIKIGKICYNNYIYDDKDWFKEYIISDSSNNEIKLRIYNPKFSSISSLGINILLINIEIKDSKYEYEIDGIKSDFFCIDKKSIKEIDLFKYKNKCFLNFFINLKKMKNFLLLL